MEKPRLYIASRDEIKRGETADIYFLRTKRILEKSGLRERRVRAEFHVTSLPRGYEWAVFAGLEEALAILEGRNVDVYALPEGTIFGVGEPLMVIEGPYYEFAELETAVLGVLRHASSIASKAARVKLAAGEKPVLFFGLRAVHPAIAPAVDRAAYIGGVDGVAGVASERYLGVRPVGTMPHALVIVFGDQKEAWSAFDRYVEEDVPRIMLVDTFCDEREEALMAARLLGDRLWGVRLDTPSSRRGSMRRIVEEVRWTLDLHGYRHVKIVVSGGLDEDSVRELRDVADAFGVGTSIAFPPSIDISMDIVEVDYGSGFVPRTKRGKLPGAKMVYACGPCKHLVLPFGVKPPSDCKPLTRLYMKGGRVVEKLPDVHEIREYVLEQLRRIEECGGLQVEFRASPA